MGEYDPEEQIRKRRKTEPLFLGAKKIQQSQSWVAAPTLGDPEDKEDASEYQTAGSSKKRRQRLKVLRQAYGVFQGDAIEQLRVALIHRRAAQLRRRFASALRIDAELFAKEIEPYEREVIINEDDVTGVIRQGTWEREEPVVTGLIEAVEKSDVRIQGNLLAGARHPSEPSGDDRVEGLPVERIHRVLRSNRLPAWAKYERLTEHEGLAGGPASALVTIMHPMGFSLQLLIALSH